nr:retrovirus-related Pol polyprotein from transposon TNT 1-94 [Tanacetum cinerariifolium]
MMVQDQEEIDEAVNEEMDDSLERVATTATSLDAEQERGNIFKNQSKATPNEPGSQGTSSGGGLRCQETMRDTVAQSRSERVSKISNDLLLAGVNTPRSGEDSLKLNELMELCTKLQQRVLDLEATKTTQAMEIDSLKKRIKKLERRKRSRTHVLKRLYKGASSSSEVMPLTFQPYSTKERPGLGIMKHTKTETQDSFNKSVSGTITVSEIKQTTSSVPTKVKYIEQELKLNELTKLVQMLTDEKVNSNQMTQESSKIQKTESSKSVDASRMSQDSKPKVHNTGSSKSLRPKPIQKTQLKCELYHYNNHLTYDCYRILYCIICKREDHQTLDHEMYIASFNRSKNYKAQPYQNYPECEICGSYDHSTSGHNRNIHIRGGVLAESSQSNESLIRVKCNTCGSIVHSTFDHNEFDHFKRGYSSISNAFRVYNTRRQQIKVTYHVTFDESMEAIRFTNTSVDEIGIDDSSIYPTDESLYKDDTSRQYQVDYDISYYVIPHGRSLTELT